MEGHSYRLSEDECGLLPVGVTHGYRNESDEPALLLEANSPVPRTSGPPDTFWTGEPLPRARPARSPTYATRAHAPCFAWGRDRWTWTTSRSARR